MMQRGSAATPITHDLEETMKSTYQKHQYGTWKKAVIAAAVSSCIAHSPITLAEDAESEAPEEKATRVEVTGSRIKRIDLESAAPVLVISRDELERTGAVSAAEALRASNLNSFGSWGGGANNSWGSQSTISLKGLGADRSLILINGHRMVKSPVMGGGAANLNMLPLSAIDRIEIMTDGASAIYGTDAIAGVVNVILRKDYDGFEVSGETSNPTRDGGRNNRFSMSGGASSEKSSLMFVYEHDETATIYQRDREFSKNNPNGAVGTEYIQGWTGLSSNARNIARASDGSWDVLPMISGATGLDSSNLCSVYNTNGESGFHPSVLLDYDWPADRLCGYDYTNRAGLTSGIKRDNLMLSFKRELTENTSVFTQAYFARSETEDVSAPSTASWTFANDLPSYTTAEGITLTPVFAGDVGYYRLNTNGDRVAEHTDTMLSILAGFQGSLGTAEWDFSVQHNRYNRSVFGTGYALTSAIVRNIGRWDSTTNTFIGWDPRDPNSEIPGGIRANFDKKDESVLNEVFAGISFDIATLPAGPISAYVGASYQEEQFLGVVDGLAESGVISGGNSGTAGIANRDASAMFMEFVVPAAEGLELSFALRYDDYSDFGSTTNPKVSASYRPTDFMMLRASWGTGFRAPTLEELNRETQYSYDRVIDYVRCAGLNNGDISVCPSAVIENIVTGNKELEAETSTSWNAGIVLGQDNWNATIDYWNVELEDTIVELSGSNIAYRQYLLDVAASGTGSAYVPGSGASIGSVVPGSSIIRTDPNDPISRVLQLYRPSVNAGLIETSGVDLTASYSLATSAGDFKVQFGWSHIIDRVNTLASGEGVTENYIGDIGWPQDRFNTTLSYVIDAHTLSLYRTDIASQKDTGSDSNGNTVTINSVPSSTLYNFTYQWATPWNVDFGFGVRNLTDEDPAFDEEGSYDSSLYYSNLFGRTYFANITVNF